MLFNKKVRNVYNFIKYLKKKLFFLIFRFCLKKKFLKLWKIRKLLKDLIILQFVCCFFLLSYLLLLNLCLVIFFSKLNLPKMYNLYTKYFFLAFNFSSFLFFPYFSNVCTDQRICQKFILTSTKYPIQFRLKLLFNLFYFIKKNFSLYLYVWFIHFFTSFLSTNIMIK